MPYRPIAPQADDRRQKQGAIPIELTNALVRRTPADSPKAARSPYFIAPTPGRTLRATMVDTVRGLFSEMGCRSGNLFIPNGSVLSEMTSSLSYTDIGALSGGDVVTMRADRSDLAVRAFGQLKRWNGTALTTVSDGDAPTFAQTLAIVARRWVAAFQDNDVFGWSKAGDFSDWDANGQAADFDLPDPIVGQEEIGGDLWSFNSRSTQIWQPTGGAEASAFAPLTGVNIKVGLASREASAPMGGGRMILGHNRVVYGTQGYALTPVQNLALEQALKALTPAQIAAAIAWSYEDGSKQFWGLNAAGLDRAYVFDADTGLWHERTRYGESAYDVDFTASAFGRVFAASKSSMKLWTLDDDVYTDDGDPIQRDFTVSVPSQGDVPVDRIVFDITTRDVPNSGQGSAPKMQARYSADGGESWDGWRDIDLPTRSSPHRAQDWGLPMASAENGLLAHFRLTDPIGFAFHGAWVNPTPEELNT